MFRKRLSVLQLVLPHIAQHCVAAPDLFKDPCLRFFGPSASLSLTSSQSTSWSASVLIETVAELSSGTSINAISVPISND